MPAPKPTKPSGPSMTLTPMTTAVDVEASRNLRTSCETKRSCDWSRHLGHYNILNLESITIHHHTFETSPGRALHAHAPVPPGMRSRRCQRHKSRPARQSNTWALAELRDSELPKQLSFSCRKKIRVPMLAFKRVFKKILKTQNVALKNSSSVDLGVPLKYHGCSVTFN